MILFRHILLGTTLIVIGIILIRFIHRNPDLYRTLKYNKVGIYGLGIAFVFIGILELFGCINWHW